MMMYSQYDYDTIKPPEAEFKEFETWLKHGLLHLKLYSVFRNLSRSSIGTDFCG